MLKETATRKLCIHDIELEMSDSVGKASKNSTLMVTLYIRPLQALKDLQSGEISVEELNHQNEKGWSILHYLCRHARNIEKSEEIIGILLKSNINVNLKNLQGYTALILACMNTNTTSTEDIVEMLLMHPEVNVNVHDDEGDTALICVAFMSHKSSTLNTMKLLLAHRNIEVNAQNNDGASALNVACSANEQQFQVIELLLSHPKIDVNHSDNDNYTPLMDYFNKNGRQSSTYSYDIVKLFLSRSDLNINYRSLVDGYTTLMILCQYFKDDNEVSILEFLLAYRDINPNLQNKAGWTALMIASRYANSTSSSKAVKGLLQYKEIDCNLKNNDGFSALTLASKKKVLKLLLESGHCQIDTIQEFHQMTCMKPKLMEYLVNAIKQQKAPNIIHLRGDCTYPFC